MDVGQENEIKNEVVAAYNEVLRKLKVVKNNSDDEVETPSQEEQLTEEGNRVVELASRDTSDDIVKQISDLKLEVSKSLDDIKFKLVAEYEKFDTLRQAIKFSKNELEMMHGIKVSANTLSALVMAHKEKVSEFNQELFSYRQAFEQEKENNERAKREEENEYVFRRETLRRKDQEQYDAKVRQQELELADQRIAFENDFEAREARLAAREREHQQLKDREAWIIAREQEYQQLKDKVAVFPEELRQSVQKVERTITDQLTRKYEYDAKLVRIESESERKVYQQKISALEEQIEQYKQLKQAFALKQEDEAIVD